MYAYQHVSFWGTVEENKNKNFSTDLNLQSMCLRKVINCFERFHLAYENSTDIRIKRGIEFLQRKHSSYIATELSNMNALEDKYFGIIINKYLKRIDNLWFKTEKGRKVAAEKIKEIDHTIEYFDADHFEEITCIDILKSLPNLKHFICNYNEFTTKILETLHNYCSNLETLEIGDISCIVLSHAINLFGPKKNGEAAFPNLKNIKVLLMAFSEEDVKYLLKNLRALEEFNYPGLPTIIYSMHKVDFENNVLCSLKQYNLRKLDFHGVFNLKDTANICASMCPNVREMSIEASQEHVDACSIFPNLEVVEFGGFDFRLVELNIEKFIKIRGANLTSLCFTKCKFSCDVILEYCMKLQKLTLDKVIIECAEPYLSSKFNLEELCLISMFVGNSTIDISLKRILDSSHSLKIITFCECNFFYDFEPIFLHFCKQGSLEILNIFDTDMYSTLPDILLSCPSLKILTVRHPQDVDLTHLTNIANIIPNKPFVDHSVGTDIESGSFSNDEENYLHIFANADFLDEFSTDDDDDAYVPYDYSDNYDYDPDSFDY